MFRELINIKRDQEFEEEVEEFMEEYEGVQDRALVNEAIRHRLDIGSIELLLKKFPRACESGGCVDHVDHPIHVACTSYRRAVSSILRFAPESAGQLDGYGRPPIEVLLMHSENQDPSDEFSTEELINTSIKLFTINPSVAKECVEKIEKLKEETVA